MSSNLYRQSSNAASRETKAVQKRGAEHRENLKQQAATKALMENLEMADRLPKLLGQMEALEKALNRPVAVTAKLPPPPAKPKTVARPDPMKSSAAAAAAVFLRRTKQRPEKETIEEIFPGPENALKRKLAYAKILKSSTDPATTTNALWAASLVQSDTLAFLSPLEKQSVLGGLVRHGARRLPFGDNNSLTMPSRNRNGQMRPAFVAEGATIPVKDGTINSSTYMRYKTGLISTFSNELARVSTPQIAEIIEETITDDLIDFLDGYILEPTLGAIGITAPASPFNGATNQASSGTDFASIVADLSWLLNNVLAVRPRKPVLIMDPARVLRLRMLAQDGQFIFRKEIEEKNEIFGVPLIVSPNVPTDKVYTIDADDFAVWLNSPEIDISNSVTLVMVDDQGTVNGGAEPAMQDYGAVTTAGSIEVSDAAGTLPASEVHSTFQQNAQALRHINEVSWGMFRLESRAYLTGVAW